ncbi:MAG: AraC family transcriptional regulator [Sphingobacteriales bacterium]|nr:MAG: AraC family transcriptional regulator [Sphingobacteriales bacterium]
MYHKAYPTYAYPSGEVLNPAARLCCFDNPCICPYDHFHTHEYNKILVFKDGGGNHHINFRNHQIAGNSIHLLAAHDLHWLERTQQAAGFAILYKDQLVQKLQLLNPDLDCCNMFRYSRVINLDAERANDFEFIFRELLSNQGNSTYLLQVIATFLIKIAHLERNIAPEHKTFDTVVAAATELVDQYFKTKKTIDFYAAALNLTPRTLQNRLKKASITSLNELLQQRVLKEAKKLLCTGEMSIGAIATELGFKETAHFSNWFHKQAHCCPMAYKHGMD